MRLQAGVETTGSAVTSGRPHHPSPLLPAALPDGARSHVAHFQHKHSRAACRPRRIHHIPTMSRLKARLTVFVPPPRSKDCTCLFYSLTCPIKHCLSPTGQPTSRHKGSTSCLYEHGCLLLLDTHCSSCRQALQQAYLQIQLIPLVA